MGRRTTALLKLRSQRLPDFFEGGIIYRSLKIYPGPERVRAHIDFSERSGPGYRRPTGIRPIGCSSEGSFNTSLIRLSSKAPTSAVPRFSDAACR
jgi:hypothetical protein